MIWGNIILQNKLNSVTFWTFSMTGNKLHSYLVMLTDQCIHSSLFTNFSQEITPLLISCTLLHSGDVHITCLCTFQWGISCVINNRSITHTSKVVWPTSLLNVRFTNIQIYGSFFLGNLYSDELFRELQYLESCQYTVSVNIIWCYAGQVLDKPVFKKYA